MIRDVIRATPRVGWHKRATCTRTEEFLVEGGKWKEKEGPSPRRALRYAVLQQLIIWTPHLSVAVLFGELVEGLDWRRSTPMGLSRLYMPVTRLDGAAQASALELSLSPCPALTRLLRAQQRRT